MFICDILNLLRKVVIKLLSKFAEDTKNTLINVIKGADEVGTEVGIVATISTIKNKLYETYLIKNQIKQIIPIESEQQEIGKLINNLVLNRYDNIDRKKLTKIIEHLTKKGLSTVILACTDLQLISPKIEGVQIFDTMKILAEATVNKLLE